MRVCAQCQTEYDDDAGHNCQASSPAKPKSVGIFAGSANGPSSNHAAPDNQPSPTVKAPEQIAQPVQKNPPQIRYRKQAQPQPRVPFPRPVSQQAQESPAVTQQPAASAVSEPASAQSPPESDQSELLSQPEPTQQTTESIAAGMAENPEDDPMSEETLDMRFHVEKREDPVIGSIIADRYEIVSRVGTGGMGVVYKAQHRNIDRLVAIKMMHPHVSSDPVAAIKRFQQEAQAVSKVEHPHTVRIYDFGVSEVNAQPFLVMDFVDGVCLRDVLKKDGALSISRVADIFEQTIEAVAAAHEVGVIHRDLKPENIMLAERGNTPEWVYVVDFGISSMADPRDQAKLEPSQTPKRAMGSPPYMSPEQCSGLEADARSDIYALGILLFEALSGRLPFNARTQAQFIESHLSARPIALKTTNEALSACEALTELINRALEKKPEKRQQSLAELGADLKEAIKRDTIRLNYLKNRKDLITTTGSTIPAITPEAAQTEALNGAEAQQDPATQSETGTRQKALTPFINCPHCNEHLQRDIAFCLGCGRSLANAQEFSKMRAATGVFALPKQQDSLSGGVPTFSQKTRALSVEQQKRKTNKTLWIVSALLALSIFFVAGGPELLAKAISRLVSQQSADSE